MSVSLQSMASAWSTAMSLRSSDLYGAGLGPVRKQEQEQEHDDDDDDDYFDDDVDGE